MKANKIPTLLFLTTAILIGCQNGQNLSIDKTILAENDSIAILYQVVDSAKDEYDIPEVAIWIRNKTTEQETILYQTIRPDWHCWYMPDGNTFYPVPMDSILVTNRVSIYNENPLQLIAEGCPDMRNEFSYFIDVPNRKVWYVPANSGYLGSTEEGYMIFRSYRYVSDPDIAGRYTFLQVFNNKCVMVDSLDLEHVILTAHENENANN